VRSLRPAEVETTRAPPSRQTRASALPIEPVETTASVLIATPATVSGYGRRR
jgi:hypothetical protein